MAHFEYCPILGLQWWLFGEPIIFDKPVIKHTFDRRVKADKNTPVNTIRRIIKEK